MLKRKAQKAAQIATALLSARQDERAAFGLVKGCRFS